MLDKSMDVETVLHNGMRIGYRVRSTHFYGINQDHRIGWLAGKKLGNFAIAFDSTIYKTREEAAEALMEDL